MQVRQRRSHKLWTRFIKTLTKRERKRFFKEGEAGRDLVAVRRFERL